MLLAELKSALKQRIAEGANAAIRQLEEVLRPDSDKFNEFVQIKGRYNAYLNAVVIGAASKAELDSQYNHISAALLIFTDSLRDEHLRPDEQAPGPAQTKRGELLYHIPHEMQTAHEYKCAVRVAYLRALLYEDWQQHADDVQKSIPVAEIMSVELLNQDSSEPFEIRSFSDMVQFLDQDFHTEWEFYVKPRRLGAFPLLLKISVVETRNGRDVKRNIVLEERVVVSTDAPLEVETVFQRSDVSLDLSPANPLTANSQQSNNSTASNSTTHLPAEASAKAGQPSNSTTSKPLRAMALFLAFIMLSSSATWAFTPPATRDWWVAAVRDSAEGYTAYIEKHGDSGPANPRLETAYFRKAEKTDSLPDLRLYTEQYPQGEYAPRVTEKIERHEVRAVASIRQQPDAAKVRRYLVDYPDARHLPEVKQAVEQQMPAEQQTALLPAIETGYVRTMQAQPTAQKFEQYRRDYPRTNRLTEMAQAAATSPAVLQAVQPALDEVIVEKTQAASSPAEVEAVLPALQAAGSPRAAERVAQMVEQKPAPLRKRVAAQVREVRAKVEQRERQLSREQQREQQLLGSSKLPRSSTPGSSTPATTPDAPGTQLPGSSKLPGSSDPATIAPPAPDSDGDGTPDATDGCPDDSAKTDPGTCGCNKPDTDSDGDGTPDCNDKCPNEKGIAADNGCPPPNSPPIGVDRKSGLKMVSVTGGTFLMGSPTSEKDRYENECQHSVTVRSFSIGQYEVTQADWREVMGKDPSDNKGCDDCPVEQVSWDDIQDFLKALNNREKASGKKYRLPTEEEWEYAARGGSKSKGYKYAGSDNLGEVAWYDSNYKAGNTFGSEKSTRPVGTKKANELGLYDMSGNVYEWCEDLYKAYPGCTGGGGSNRVLRGGGWDDTARGCRSAYRSGWPPVGRVDFLGFRLVLAPQ